MGRKILMNPVILGLLFMFAVSCNKEDDATSVLPILTTSEMDEISSTTAISGGVITSDGGADIVERGVCWSSSTTPTIAHDRTIDGSGMGAFVSSMDNLYSNVTYYVRAYATTSNGTGYGNLVTFITNKGIPMISTSDITKITTFSAVSGGVIVYDGGDSITFSGVCWGVDDMPTLADNITSDTVRSGTFVDTMTNLSTNTLYYVRAYATNSYGTAYGDVVAFYSQQGGEILEFTTVDIPAGSFIMGSSIDELYRGADETQHNVTLSAFSMSKYEITNAQFAAFLNSKNIEEDGLYAAGKYPTEPLIYGSVGTYNWGLTHVNRAWTPVVGFENHPVILVTWFGADEYARFVGGSLPTEAQWEYACRANTSTPFYAGECLTNLQANYNWASPYDACSNNNTTSPGTTQAVGSYEANEFGLYGMHGNVGEWCADYYAEYTSIDQTDPQGPESGTTRVIRSGGWSSNAKDCRSAKRYKFSPDGSDYLVGFRVVLNK